MIPITTTEELPEELQEMVEEMRASQRVKLESIGKYAAKCRDEAVSGRKLSGIEKIWDEDEEYYQGIDDANRTTHTWLKSPSTAGGLRSPHQPNTSNRCTSFFNITRQFVESGSARMGDILLPAGDWNFTAKATPVQDKGSEDPSTQKEAEARAERGETWIHDKLTECHYHVEVRKCLEDAAKLGTGVLKGPFPDKSILRKAVIGEDGSYGLEIVHQTSPVSRSVDPRDFFPDPACGDDIQNGNYVIERDRFTARQLRKLKGVKGYHDDLIDKVLDEGPSRKNYTDTGSRKESTAEDDTFEVFYFYGEIDANDMSAMCAGGKESERKMVPAIVTLVNDTAIKAVVDPLESGTFPYDVMPWQRISGQWFGMGISRQGRTAQDMLNAAMRNLMDNAGLAGKPQVIFRRSGIVPQNGEWIITSGKVWLATEEADARSVQDAMAFINIPMMQAELNAIADRAFKMMEDATGISFLLMGQQGSAPDTVGGMELLHRNASALLRRLARTFDERVTEPHIRRWHAYLLMHGPEDCKGDLKISAVGSTALVEREIQSMDSMVLLQLSANPIYGLDPTLAMVEVLKAKRFNPDKWVMSEESNSKIQIPAVPAIEVAKIRAAQEDKKIEADKWKTKVIATARLHETEIDVDRDTIYNESLAAREETSLNLRLEELKVKRELAMLEYATRKDISLNQIKSDLAKESMRLRTQKELSAINGTGPEVAIPAVEPVQHAENGRSFQE